MKHKITVLIALVIMITCASAVCSAAGDTAGHKYANDVALLSNIGLMTGYDDGNFYPERNITRQEFSALVLRMLKMEGCGNGENVPFTDIDTWGRSYICDAYALGLIEGYNNTTFGPDDPLTMNQAVKIIVSALGYGDWAQNNGGYPYGYNTFAAKNDILDRVGIGENYATRGQVAALIVNSLDVQMSDMVFERGGNVQYTKGDITLAEYLGMKKVKGILAGAGAVNLTDKEIAEDEIIIGDVAYKTNIRGLDGYIGNTVYAYISDEEPYTAYHVFMTTEDNSLTVSSKDISDSTTKDCFVYTDDNNKSRKINIKAGAIIVYNGKLLPSSYITDEIFRPDSGSVTFTSFANDTNYDVIKITEYDTYIAESVFGNNIYDLFGRRISTEDFDDDDNRLVILKNGENISLSEIERSNVLAVAQSIDKEYMTIYVSDAEISGEVTATAVSEDRTSIWIDDKELKTSVWYDEKIAQGDSRVKKINSGDSIKALLDINGDIAFVKESDSDSELRYGLLIDIEANNAIGNNGQVKILTTDNEFIIYDITGKIKFGHVDNGSYKVSSLNADDICTILNNTMPISKVQLIKYAAKDNGLKKMYLSDEDGKSGYLELVSDVYSGHYRAGVIDGKYIVNDDTMLFIAPGNGSEIEKLSASYAKETLKNGSNSNIKIYDVKNGVVGAMVKVNTIVSGSLMTAIDMVNSDVMLVLNAKHVTNEKGDTYLTAEGFVNGEMKTVLFSDTLSSNSESKNALKKGCLIQYATNKTMLGFAQYNDYDEVVEVFKVLHDLNDTTATEYQSWNYTDIRSDNAQIGITYGTVSYKNNEHFTATIGQEDNTCAFMASSSTQVYKYSRSEKKAEICTYDDVSVGMTVLIRQRYGNVREIIIVEE